MSVSLDLDYDRRVYLVGSDEDYDMRIKRVSAGEDYDLKVKIVSRGEDFDLRVKEVTIGDGYDLRVQVVNAEEYEIEQWQFSPYRCPNCAKGPYKVAQRYTEILPTPIGTNWPPVPIHFVVYRCAACGYMYRARE